MNRTVEIDVFIIITPGIFCKVINAAHGDDAIEQIWSFKEEVGAVQCAKRGTAYDYRCIPTCAVLNKRNHLFVNIVIELHVPHYLMTRIHVIVHPAFVVDAVDGKHLTLPLLNEGRDGAYELEPFIFQ